MPRAAGMLSVVGTGIRAACQVSPEALRRIQDAQALFFLLNDPLTRYWLRTLNPNAEALEDLYRRGKDRENTYREMIERVMRAVRCGSKVCFVSYGHPGVFGFPMHEAVSLARSEGFQVEMLPAISSEDMLFAELGVDPGNAGCQSFEATDFLIRRRNFDPTSALILWQIGIIAVKDYINSRRIWNVAGLRVLVDFLIDHYSSDHEVIAYEASPFAWCPSRITRKTLGTLADTDLNAMATLYVPPKAPRPPNQEMVERLRQTIVS